MNAVERLEAAITKLEEIKAVGWPCAEYTRGAVRHIARNCDISCDDEDHYEGWDRYETAPALMVLIATIEPQLAILRDARDLFNERLDFRAEMSEEWRAEHHADPARLWPVDIQPLALADAILGGSDADVG